MIHSKIARKKIAFQFDTFYYSDLITLLQKNKKYHLPQKTIGLKMFSVKLLCYTSRVVSLEHYDYARWKTQLKWSEKFLVNARNGSLRNFLAVGPHLTRPYQTYKKHYTRRRDKKSWAWDYVTRCHILYGISHFLGDDLSEPHCR